MPSKTPVQRVPRLYQGDVGILGMGRIVSALAGVAGIFWLITKLTVANEVKDLEIRITERIRSESAQLVTKPELDKLATETSHRMEKLDETDRLISQRIIDENSKLEEMQRQIDRAAVGHR